MSIGYAAWFEEELAREPSLQRPALEAGGAHAASHSQRVELWWRNVVRGGDQLRQRVAWALSQILVVSDVNDLLAEEPLLAAEYYDVLVRGALGSYRELLGDVSTSPAMGLYLSMLQNPKPDPLGNVHPDENFAREVMQLFSIGLVMLNPDGTPVLDGADEPVPTYDIDVVIGTAHALTGWNYAGADEWHESTSNPQPMKPWEALHDTQPKVLVNGFVTSAGQGAQQDLDTVLDLLFEHPNAGPFLGRRLIQHLVTSNPSPDYVARVAAAFADDGQGQRGDLFAVVQAVLTDPEARQGHATAPSTFGKLREPILRLAQLWRAFDADSASGTFGFADPQFAFAQAPLRAPSVFNFYSPDHQPPGAAAAAGLVAPEFEISTHTYLTRTTNELFERVFGGFEGVPGAHPDAPLIDIAYEQGLAADPAALVDHLDLVLMAGGMSAEMRSVVRGHVEGTPHGTDGTARVLEALYLVVSSPEYAVQK